MFFRSKLPYSSAQGEDDPNFYNMVGNFFEKGARLVEDKLVDQLSEPWVAKVLCFKSFSFACPREKYQLFALMNDNRMKYAALEQKR